MPRRRYYRRKPRRWKKPYRDNACSYCGRKFTELSYRCNYCGERFCSYHHLPEKHKCGGLPSRSWDTYATERGQRKPIIVKEPPTWIPVPAKQFPKYKSHKTTKLIGKVIGGIVTLTVIVVVGLLIWTVFIPWLGTFTGTSPTTTTSTSIVPTVTITTTTVPTTTTTTSFPSSTSVSQVLPLGYYNEASKTYSELSIHDIQSLYNVLMSEACEMPSYDFIDFSCSTASARLEWILEGYGFHTRFYMSQVFDHTWLMVELDDGLWVAIESTVLTSGNYWPPAIIEGPNGEYHEYSYLYQMYRDYLQKYGGGGYILPTSYDDFLQNYLQDIYNPLEGLDYYSGTEFYESLEDVVQPGFYYYSITGFDWWNTSPYNSIAPFSGWG